MLMNGQLGQHSADSTAGRNLDAARVPSLPLSAQLAHTVRTMAIEARELNISFKFLKNLDERISTVQK